MEEQRQLPANRITAPAGARVIPAAVALTPKEIVGIVRQHIFLIVSLTVLGLAVGGGSWFLMLRYAPRYTAQTFVRVLPPVEKDPMTITAAQVQKDIQYGYRLSMADLITQQSTLQELLARDKIQQTKWFQAFGEIRDKRIRKAFRQLRKRFGAYAHRDADYIVVSMTCGNAREAALIVNEMVDFFIESQGGKKRAEVADKLVRLTTQRDSVQKEFDAAERGLDEVRKASGLTDLQERVGGNYQHTITLRLNDLELQQNDLSLEISQLQADIENLTKLATGPVTEQIEHQIETDPVMTVLAEQLAFNEAELSGRLTKFGENHRVVRQTQELINEIRQKRLIRKAEIAEQTRQALLHNAEDQLIVLQQRYTELERMRQEAQAKEKDLDLARIQYRQREVIRDERKQMLDSIKEQIDKLRIMREDPETPKVQFVGYAPEPLEVSSPRWQIFFPGGTMLGLMLGIGLTFLLELLNDLVRTPRDVIRHLHIPLLGVIPDIGQDEQVADIEPYLAVRKAPYSITSESYRRCRTNLKLSGIAESLKVLLVSSGAGGDGKTSVAVNLAETFVAENKEVLLIDANFRRPTLHSIFPKPKLENQANDQPEFGLSILLAGLCGYKEIIRPTGIEGLSIIDAGPLPSNPTELLGGAQMTQLLKHQRQNFDYIIIDGPPVLLVSEAKLLAKFVDGTVLVFNASKTTRGAAQRTIREFREADAKILGCILVAVKAMKGGYFREQFRSYREYEKLQLVHST